MDWSELENGWKDWQADARLRWRRLSDQQAAITKNDQRWLRAGVGVTARTAAVLAVKA